MKVGDIIKIHSSDEHKNSIGILIKMPRQMFMAGELAEVMIDGQVKYIKKELIEIIKKRD